MITYVEKVCTLTSCIFSMMLAGDSILLSRTDKCPMILSSLLGQSMANTKKETEDSLGPCLFRCDSVSLDLSSRGLFQLCSDLLDLRFEGSHGAFD